MAVHAGDIKVRTPLGDKLLRHPVISNVRDEPIVSSDGETIGIRLRYTLTALKNGPYTASIRAQPFNKDSKPLRWRMVSVHINRDEPELMSWKGVDLKKGQRYEGSVELYPGFIFYDYPSEIPCLNLNPVGARLITAGMTKYLDSNWPLEYDYGGERMRRWIEQAAAERFEGIIAVGKPKRNRARPAKTYYAVRYETTISIRPKEALTAFEKSSPPLCEARNLPDPGGLSYRNPGDTDPITGLYK